MRSARERGRPFNRQRTGRASREEPRRDGCERRAAGTPGCPSNQSYAALERPDVNTLLKREGLLKSERRAVKAEIVPVADQRQLGDSGCMNLKTPAFRGLLERMMG